MTVQYTKHWLSIQEQTLTFTNSRTRTQNIRCYSNGRLQTETGMGAKTLKTDNTQEEHYPNYDGKTSREIREDLGN